MLACLTHLVFLQAIDTRLNNWMAALHTRRWEVERHQRRQQQAVIPMEEQNQFLEVQ